MFEYRGATSVQPIDPRLPGGAGFFISQGSNRPDVAASLEGHCQSGMS